VSTAVGSDRRAQQPFRCSDAARTRDDPIAGTAPPVLRWLLLEHPGPWRIDAVAGLPLSPDVRAALTHAAARAGARILLVRRPGRPVLGAPRHWMIADQDGATVTGPWRDEEDLQMAAAALETPAPRDGRRDPLILVCTHGVHDVCCAVRGRPVAEALEKRFPGQVWECSHVGGDRFAPNVVVLPDGFYYGLLDVDSAVSTVERHLGGDVPVAHLRGVARFAPPLQAAVAEAYRRLAPLPPGAVHAGAEGGVVPHGETTVDLRVDGSPVGYRAVVRAVRRPAAQLTCRAVRETSATAYDVLSFEAVGR
jgi:(2Fe-2S) ferredoxin